MIDREFNEAFYRDVQEVNPMKPTKSFVKDIHHFVGMLNVLDWLD